MKNTIKCFAYLFVLFMLVSSQSASAGKISDPVNEFNVYRVPVYLSDAMKYRDQLNTTNYESLAYPIEKKETRVRKHNLVWF